MAEAIKRGRITKPLVAWVMGTCASIFPYEVQFGHAGATNRQTLFDPFYLSLLSLLLTPFIPFTIPCYPFFPLYPPPPHPHPPPHTPLFIHEPLSLLPSPYRLPFLIVDPYHDHYLLPSPHTPTITGAMARGDLETAAAKNKALGDSGAQVSTYTCLVPRPTLSPSLPPSNPL